MIDIAPDTACILYLAISLSVVLFIWVCSKKKEIARFHVRPRHCEFCHHSYLEEIEKPVSRCPQCQLLNKQ